jgi:hypothetical protein
MCTAGLLVERRGDRDGADLLLRAALAEEPACAVDRVYFYLRGNDRAQAAEAVKRVPEGCERERALAAVANADGRSAQARLHLEAAFQRCGSGVPALRFELARARLADGDRSGLAMLEALLGAYDDVAVHRVLAAEYRAGLRYEEALPHLEWLVAGGHATAVETDALQTLRGAPR